jgi:hypothetical protein
MANCGKNRPETTVASIEVRLPTNHPIFEAQLLPLETSESNEQFLISPGLDFQADFQIGSASAAEPL